MKMMFKLALQYIKRSKRKSCFIILCVVFAVAMITIVNTLQYSSHRSEIEYTRQKHGDFHYIYNVDQEQLDAIYPSLMEDHIEELGKTRHIRTIENPYVMELVVPDEKFLEMTGATLQSGRLPDKENEVAMEEWTLNNIGYDIQVGNKIYLEGNEYILTGILKDREMIKDTGLKQVFVSPDFMDYQSNSYRIYVKFNENRDIEEDCYAFAEKYAIIKNREDKKISENASLLEELGVNKVLDKANLLDAATIRGVIGNTGFRSNIIIVAISIFGAYIIYSIFYVSVHSRLTDYGIMMALGIKWIKIYFITTLELLLLSLIGLPIGYLSGISTIILFYDKFSSTFLVPGITPGPIYFPIDLFIKTFIVLTFLIFVISYFLVRRVGTSPIIDTVRTGRYLKNQSYKKIKSYSDKGKNMVNVVMYKYMVNRKLLLVSILISLALGGSILLSTNYVIDQTIKNNELTLKADDGISSDYQISVDDARIQEAFSIDQISRIADVKGVSEVHPIRYFFGGIVLKQDKLLMKEYFDFQKDVKYIDNVFGGVWTKESDRGDYLLKSGIYGFDETMTDTMKDYVVEGNIEYQDLISDNKVLVRLPMDGVGNYNSIDLHPGDKIKVKVQRTLEINDELLKFPLDKEEAYEYKEFTVAATVKRSLITNDYFIGDYGADIIMANSQMDKNFGVKEYQMASVIKDGKTDNSYIRTELQKIVHEVKKATLRDFTAEIEKRNHHLLQGRIFMYGIVTIILTVSLFNIFNSITYLMIARRNDFAVLRAMGITDKRFWIMLLQEGFLYGLFSSIIMVSMSLLIQQVIKYLLGHVYLYINVDGGVHIIQYAILTILNIMIGMTAVIFPAKDMLSNSIISELSSTD